jgi:hypothetical protein
MGKRALDAASARLYRAGHRAGEAHATCGSGQTHAYVRSGVVDNYSGAVEGTWSTRSYLVAGHPAAQPGSTVRQFAQTMLVQNEPHHAT